ncbi:hypothetical protein [Flavobacterium sp.]|uniref:TRADD-N-associated membrane domain-containing protein n=1 Tax=Flavobacterium sp. TaxID=239 RepID=UPI0031D39F86
MEALDYTSQILSIIISLIAVLTVILIYFRNGRIKFGNIKLDFNDSYEKEAEAILEGIPTEHNDNNSDDKKLALFLQYHSQGLAQSKISFWFSLVFAAIGFCIIVISLLAVKPDVSIMQQGKAFITLISGTIIDAVSALFFVQSNRARQLMTDFFDKLRNDRKFEESLKLADQIPDNHLKSKVKILLSLNFADIKTSDDVLTLILNGIENSPRPNPDES